MSLAESTPDRLAGALEASMHEFWQTVALLEPEEIERGRLADGWTPKAVVAHVAFWDDYQTRRMAAALAGESAQAGFARPLLDNDARALDDADRPWADVMADAEAARDRMVAFARSLPPEALAHDHPEGERTLSLSGLLQHMVRHTRQHGAALFAYCGSMRRWPRPALRGLLEQQHANLLDSVAGLTETTMHAVQVCGVWSIRDVLAHVLSWNEGCVQYLAGWPEPDPATVTAWAWQPGDTMDSMNARLMAARAGLDPIAIADGLATAHRKMMTIFDRMSDADLEGKGLTWGGPGVLSCFFFEVAMHDAEHAAQIWAYRAGETGA